MMLLLFLTAGPVCADVVVFRSGERVTVENLVIRDTEITYLIDGLQATVPLDLVDLDRTREANASGVPKAAPLPATLPPTLAPDAPGYPFPKRGSVRGEEAVRLVAGWEAEIAKQVRALKGELHGTDAVITVPFRRCEGLICLEGLLNGRLPALFVLDTGAAVSSVTRATARKAGIRIRSDFRVGISTAGGVTLADWGVLESLRIGDLELKNVAVLVVDGAPDNLVGQNLLSHFVVTLDFPAAFLRLAVSPADTEAGGNAKEQGRKDDGEE
ncbi:MAG: retroviral-like aspartic protease family protein [Acidobacteria bacterium]|nr:retroviral-like aspartic protease family protein [Acidobacteriota bacterium]